MTRISLLCALSAILAAFALPVGIATAKGGNHGGGSNSGNNNHAGAPHNAGGGAGTMAKEGKKKPKGGSGPGTLSFPHYYDKSSPVLR